MPQWLGHCACIGKGAQRICINLTQARGAGVGMLLSYPALFIVVCLLVGVFVFLILSVPLCLWHVYVNVALLNCLLCSLSSLRRCDRAGLSHRLSRSSARKCKGQGSKVLQAGQYFLQRPPTLKHRLGNNPCGNTKEVPNGPFFSRLASYIVRL